MSVEIQRRHAVRGLLVDEASASVLLIHTHIPDSGKLIWLAPGGGREPGESETECLFRELEEETGLVTRASKGAVWVRQKVFKLHRQTFDQHETFHWVPVAKFEPTGDNNPAIEERDIFRGFRWWTLDEMRDARDEIFVPLTFADEFHKLLTQGLPDTPIDVGL
ncbi:MAG: NUDIX domain-containing protein [Pseudomonadaceae bacterium]|nr:NUDIX domain-containing protein [Pseudomonadaceae bacterium]